MWLNRLPWEYRRRYYTNLFALLGFFIFIVVVAALPKQQADIAILAFIGCILLFMCFWPLVRLLQCRPGLGRTAFMLYAAWILAYVYSAAALFVRRLPEAAVASLAGLVLMWAFFIAYRRTMFPTFFDGGFNERWKMIRGAQRAEREERGAILRSKSDPQA